jgi:hypothetical protein
VCLWQSVLFLVWVDKGGLFCAGQTASTSWGKAKWGTGLVWRAVVVYSFILRSCIKYWDYISSDITWWVGCKSWTEARSAEVVFWNYETLVNRLVWKCCYQKQKLFSFKENYQSAAIIILNSVTEQVPRFCNRDVALPIKLTMIKTRTALSSPDMIHEAYFTIVQTSSTTYFVLMLCLH